MAKSNFYNTAQTAEALSAKMDKLPTELGTEHLDNVVSSDIYAQSQNAQVSSSLGYPDKYAGFLHVMTTPTGLMTRQIYYPYVVSPSTSINIWTRSRYMANWTPWENIFEWRTLTPLWISSERLLFLTRPCPRVQTLTRFELHQCGLSIMLIIQTSPRAVPELSKFFPGRDNQSSDLLLGVPRQKSIIATQTLPAGAPGSKSNQQLGSLHG